MKKASTDTARVQELRAMLAVYRQMTIDEVEDGGWGDVQFEIEQELWRLEQELYDARRRAWRAA
jgi:hypothetical protein